MAAMGQATLVNVSVFCSTTHQLLLPWRILEIGNPGRTIQQFYHDVAAPLIAASSQSRTKLDKAFLGHRKSDLDEIDMEILLEVAVATFGGYVRYITSRPMHQSEKEGMEVNVFQVMMSSQRQLCLRKLPQKKKEYNSKDRLYNSILDFLEERELAFSSNEVDHTGVNLVRTLQECLWYIDGRHAMIEHHSSPIPTTFSRFVGFNVPEKSKHRKRALGNMQHDILSGLHQSLFRLLQAPFWQRDKWKELHNDVAALASSLAHYCDYLRDHCKKMKLNHASHTPVRSLSDSISVKFVKPCPRDCLSSF